MFVLREFTPVDAEALSALIRTTMRRSNTRDYPLERLQPLIDYFTPEKIARLNLERFCLVAEAGGALVGTAAREGGELCTFFVHPEHQGRGIGSRLLAAIEHQARAAGLTRLTVDASLTGAEFYARHGYRRTGSDRDGTAGTQIGMAKELL
jgi:putative acetyltransferase